MQYKTLTWNRQSCDVIFDKQLADYQEFFLHSRLVKFKLVLTLDVDEMVLNDPS